MFNLVLANLALAFTILLSILGSFLFKSAHWWFTPFTFCGVVLFLFALLRLTLDKQTLKLHKSVHYVFAIANVLSLAGLALFIIGTHEGANAIGAAMFVGIYFYIPALALFLCGIIALVAHLAR
ncbi:MAG: hypothetical protein ACXW0Q_10005, partial [Methylovulum sp.]